jgi:NADH-quinone oxidoreductase subunit G
MVKIKVDGRTVEAPAGGVLLRFLNEELGLDIPHYCYHPGLTSVGSCRLCQVELVSRRKGPGGKEQVRRALAVSCRQPIQEGLEVETDSEKVRQARRQAIEFLLANHPLDCPICDKAGECPLQDYTYATGQLQARTVEPRRHLEKLVDLGEVILLDRERCILCTRCVRFFAELEGRPQLGVLERGDRSYIATFCDDPLTGNYQGCLADICPVGALTLKKFRFKQRVWNLTTAPSVCPHCSRGCHIVVDRTRTDEVVRIRPRYNAEVNGQRTGAAGALAAARRILDRAGPGLVALASPFLTCEEGRAFAGLCAGAEVKGFLAPEMGGADGILLTDDPCPNRLGLVRAGLRGVAPEDLHEKIAAAEAVYLAGEYVEKYLPEKAAAALAGKPFIYQGRSRARAEGAAVALPTRAWTEKGGTWIGLEGREQRFAPAVPPPGETRADGDLFAALGRESKEKEA